MNGGEWMVVLIVAMAMIARVMGGRPGWRRRDRDSAAGFVAAPRDAAETERLREEVRTLKARVATLERIATDQSSSLDREIEALRDRP